MMYDILIWLMVSILVFREYFLYHVLYRKQKVIDSSNRFNKMRLIWFAVTRDYLFVDYMLNKYGEVSKWTRVKLFFDVLHNEERFAYLFWWTDNDEFENMKHRI